MKNISLIIIIFICFLWACEDMYDKQKEYLGEIVYPGKFDTIIGNVGFERVEIDLMKAGHIPSSEIELGKAKKTVIEYDDQVITIDSLVSYVSIDGLTQPKLYRFIVYSMDEFGNKSVPQEIALIPYTAEDVKLLEVPTPKISVRRTSPSNFTGNIEWTNFSSVLMDFKALTYKYTNKDGTLVNGAYDEPKLVVDNFELTEPLTVYAEYEIIPKINGVPILDSAPMMDTITFVPEDYYILPIYMLATSSGWDESSFISIEASDKGLYKLNDASFKHGDNIRFFAEASLTSEIQFGFAHFNNDYLSEIFRDTDDGNDNLVFDAPDGDYNLTIYTNANLLEGTGPYSGVSWEIPGVIEAEDYDYGGQNLGYYDTSGGNSGGAYRSNDVDIWSGGDLTLVGWTTHGEWLQYTVNVLETGMYSVDFSIGSASTSVGKLILEFDGEEKLTFQGSNTGGWVSPATFTAGEIHLDQGKHRMKIKMVNPNMNIDAAIFNKL